jgi:hypothetical protein
MFDEKKDPAQVVPKKGIVGFPIGKVLVILAVLFSLIALMKACTTVGKVGPAGAAGKAGIAGSPGPAGPVGTGIVSASINGSGHLIINLTTGALVDAGQVVNPNLTAGPQGPAGQPGAAGKEGVGIKAITVDTNGHLQVTLTDGTIKDAGVIVTPSSTLPAGQVTTSSGQPWRGVWTSAVTYNTGDVVGWNQVYYICIRGQYSTVSPDQDHGTWAVYPGTVNNGPYSPTTTTTTGTTGTGVLIPSGTGIYVKGTAFQLIGLNFNFPLTYYIVFTDVSGNVYSLGQVTTTSPSFTQTVGLPYNIVSGAGKIVIYSPTGVITATLQVTVQ